MRDVDQTGPDEVTANGVWNRGPDAPDQPTEDETTYTDD